MCGIVGYVGNKKCLPILLNGLKNLEYRGYDSAGVAIMEKNCIEIIKESGRVSALESLIDSSSFLAVLVLLILDGLLMEYLAKKMLTLIKIIVILSLLYTMELLRIIKSFVIFLKTLVTLFILKQILRLFLI